MDWCDLVPCIAPQDGQAEASAELLPVKMLQVVRIDPGCLESVKPSHRPFPTGVLNSSLAVPKRAVLLIQILVVRGRFLSSLAEGFIITPYQFGILAGNGISVDRNHGVSG